MRPLTPAQAGFLPASRDFSRQAASGDWNLFACSVIALYAAGLCG
jgi:hypothetical protein